MVYLQKTKTNLFEVADLDNDRKRNLSLYFMIFQSNMQMRLLVFLDFSDIFIRRD